MGLLIGDVSSHGFAAALIMALTMSAVAIHASEGDPPAEVLGRLHHALIEELQNTEMYFTLFYGVIDPDRRRLTYANAGHPHAFRITRSGEADRLAPTSPPFGMVESDEYVDQSTEWDTGSDLLFLFTDGLSDALGLGDGERVLVDAVVSGRAAPLEELIEAVFSIVGTDSGLPSDDRTAVLARI
jgi:phosphoserine phosphatase RsbU/P